jgi:ABC-type Na+ efflux pump permease subunit
MATEPHSETISGVAVAPALAPVYKTAQTAFSVLVVVFLVVFPLVVVVVSAPASTAWITYAPASAPALA